MCCAPGNFKNFPKYENVFLVMYSLQYQENVIIAIQIMIYAEKAVNWQNKNRRGPHFQKAGPNWKLLSPSSYTIEPKGIFNDCNWILQRYSCLIGRILWLEIIVEDLHPNHIKPILINLDFPDLHSRIPYEEVTRRMAQVAEQELFQKENPSTLVICCSANNKSIEIHALHEIKLSISTVIQRFIFNPLAQLIWLGNTV